jgi:hypothetical protein
VLAVKKPSATSERQSSIEHQGSSLEYESAPT